MKTINIYSSTFVVFILFPLTLNFSNIQQQKSKTKSVTNRNKIIEVFRKAVRMNEDFKQTVKKASLEETQFKGRILEKYYEEELSPSLDECVKLIASGNDVNLILEFFKLLISFENSADEYLSYALGGTFFNNPILVEKAFKRFKKSEQKYLYERLALGWKYFIVDKDTTDQTILHRKELLRQFQKNYVR